MNYCGKCGHLITGDSNFCGNCFTKILKTEEDYYDEILHSFNGILVALVSKVAKIDGKICEKEADYISDLLTDISEYNIPPIPNIINIYKQILNNEKDDFSNINHLCQELIKHNIEIKEKIYIIETLLELSLIDSDYNEEEEAIILEIVHHLNLDIEKYQYLKSVSLYFKLNPEENPYQNNKRIYLNENLKRVYDISMWTKTLSTVFKMLESKENDSMEVIEKNYLRLLKQYEDDSRDVFSKSVQIHSISLAYERIKKYKNNLTITKGNCFDCHSTINYEDKFCTNCGIKIFRVKRKPIKSPYLHINISTSILIAILFMTGITFLIESIIKG